MNSLTNDQNASPTTKQSVVIQPVEERPTVSKKLAIHLVETHYNSRVLEIRELKSYGDKNFYLKTSRNGGVEDSDSSNEFMLKILNSVDSAVEGMVEAQNGAMIFLKEKGIVCPFPIVSSSGDYIVYRECRRREIWRTDNGTNNKMKLNAIRLMSYVPGELLEDVAVLTPNLLFDLGNYIGKLSNILKDYNHPSLNNLIYSWDMAHLGELKHDITARYLGSKERESLIMNIYEQYISTVPQVIKSLDKQVIHNDISGTNVIVTKNSGDTTDWSISGVIDFGDMCDSYRVFEIAIAMSAIVTLDYSKGNPRPFERVGNVLKGYLSVCPLSREELDIIYWCVAGRWIQSLIAGSKTMSIDPENKYVVGMVVKIWEILPGYLKVTDKEMLDDWMKC